MRALFLAACALVACGKSDDGGRRDGRPDAGEALDGPDAGAPDAGLPELTEVIAGYYGISWDCVDPDQCDNPSVSVYQSNYGAWDLVTSEDCGQARDGYFNRVWTSMPADVDCIGVNGDGCLRVFDEWMCVEDGVLVVELERHNADPTNDFDEYLVRITATLVALPAD